MEGPIRMANNLNNNHIFVSFETTTGNVVLRLSEIIALTPRYIDDKGDECDYTVVYINSGGTVSQFEIANDVHEVAQSIESAVPDFRLYHAK